MSFNAVTWAGILAHIPQEDRERLNLEELLESKIEASVFVNIPVYFQTLILENLLGENSDLVEVIMELTSSDQVGTASCPQHDDYRLLGMLGQSYIVCY